MSSNTSFIIPNFFHTVQCAAIELFSKKPATTDQAQIALNNKIKKIAIAHLAGAAVMAVGTLIGLAALPYVLTTTIGFTLLATLGVAIYAVGHDVFAMANNAQWTKSELVQLAVPMINYGCDPLIAMQRAMTSGTFFQPLIIKFLAQRLTAAAAGGAGGGGNAGGAGGSATTTGF